MRKRIGVFLAVILIFAMSSVYAVDVIGYRNDLSFSGNTTENIAGPIKVVWVETVGSTRSQPVVIGDKLYIGTTWAMVCYNAKWGTKIWQYISKDFCHSSPFYYNNSIYAGQTNYMYCIDAKTGYQRWKYQTGENSVNSSPIIYENKVIFGSNKKVLCLSADNGVKLWEIDFPANVEHPVAFSDNMMFAVAGDKIFAFGAKLHNKLWEYQFSNKVLYGYSVSKKQIFVSIGDSLVSLNKVTGELLWKQFFPNLNAMSGTSYYGSDVYASFDQYFYCVNAENGKIKWQFETGFFIESAPSISDKYIWIGSDDFIIYCLDRVSGKKLYYGITGSTSYHTVVANNSIFSLSIYGELYSYVPDLKKKIDSVTYDLWIGKQYSRLNGKMGPIDAAPFISQGRTMVPLRHIGDALGADIKWYPDDKRITYALNTKFISLLVGSLDATVNGKSVKLELAPVLVNGRAFVPLRFVSENLGAKVSWNPTEKRITIFYQF
jgi:outer membrane protein assembly factor BamB